MCDFPIHTKLSDLISDDESDENSNITQRINLKVNFTESSSRTIDYKADLDKHSKTKNLITVPATDPLHKIDGENDQDFTHDNAEDKDSLDGDDSLDSVDYNSNNLKEVSRVSKELNDCEDCKQSKNCNSDNLQEVSECKANKELSEDCSSNNWLQVSKVNELNDSVKQEKSEFCDSNKLPEISEVDEELNDSENQENSEDCNLDTLQEFSEANKEVNDCDNQVQSDTNMSKRFGLLFQKGVRTKTEKDSKTPVLPPTPESDKEGVLPHFKSSQLKADYAESSFIEVKEDHYSEGKKQDHLEAPSQSASTSTSDDSELGTRAEPIGESADVNMAAAVSESDSKISSCDQDENKKSAVKETVPSGKSTGESNVFLSFFHNLEKV